MVYIKVNDIKLSLDNLEIFEAFILGQDATIEIESLNLKTLNLKTHSSESIEFKHQLDTYLPMNMRIIF